MRLLTAGFAFILSALFFCGAFAYRDDELVEKFSERVGEVEVIQRPRVAYTGEISRDPFKRTDEGAKKTVTAKEVKKTALPELTVQGLVWGGNFPQVIINNKVLKEGEIIQGARVIAIDKEGVTVFFEGAEYKLPSPAGGGAKSPTPLTPQI